MELQSAGGQPGGARSLEEKLAVPAERLGWTCDPGTLPFETTEDVQPLEGTLGQDRAVSALEFGVAIRGDGFNIFVTGQPGSGRDTTARAYLEQGARSQPVPDDWVYVHNFADPYRPRALRLPPGEGSRLAQRMDEVVKATSREIPRAFESEDYERRKGEVAAELQERQQALYRELQEEAQRRGFALETTPSGLVTVPLVQGQPMSREDYERLPAQTREELERKGEELRAHVGQAAHSGRKLEKEVRERLGQLERQVALFAVGHFFEELRSSYAQHPAVLEHLQQVLEDIPNRLADFQPLQQEGGQTAQADPPGASSQDPLSRYKVNVLVDNSRTRGAPVVWEPNATYYNLAGRLEYEARMGAMTTDFLQLKAGALHRANGGYLLLEAQDLLTVPLAWDGLKKALQTREIRIENIGEQLSPVPAATLRPEPIPLQCKVVLIGTPTSYYLFHHGDEEFRKLFKVRADFGPDMERSDGTVQGYAAFIARQAQERSLLPFDRTAIARMVEHGARLVEDQTRLTTRFAEITDLLVEASFWAESNGHRRVAAGDVQRAIAHREYRSNLVEERVQQLIEDGTIMIETEGERVGQVNGLSVLDTGDYSFGRPSRISARVAMGSRGVVNVEREIRLSGPIHSKGVLILTGYLNGKYAQEHPLALSATLTFEQVYDEVDGDSASSTELYALLSALSGLPLRQGIAVTGSVNQYGQIQAVGGVTRKVEGFFAVCRAKGLTGHQGVILPEANVKNLMLKEEVVRAVREDMFHLWAVRTVDQGIELLAGVPAGEPGPDGSYPPGTIHGRVATRLADYARRLRQHGTGGPALVEEAT